MKTAYKIQLREGAIPVSLTAPRKVPLPLMKELKKTLDQMLLQEVIARVDEPTEWCSALVVVPKPDGTLRICVDFKPLNKYIQREIYPMPVTEAIFGRLGKAKIFSKIDAKHGFWQCPLDEGSQKLTTFITPFGRYYFRRLPFGINAAPEFFQKRMCEILEGLEGVECNIDDCLIYGQTREEHDQRLHTVLTKLSAAGVTLNEAKCEFHKQQIKFLGHVIDEKGIRVDPDRVKAILKLGTPRNISELRSFLGTVNYLSRFTPQLADSSRALNDLLCKGNEFLWGHLQEEAFQKIKRMLAEAPILAWYDPRRPTVISADASSFGIGAVLKQQHKDGNFRPVAYASKSFTKSQQNWAQIEKEGYAITWACERFRDFVMGIPVHLETDHKPLVPLFTSKPLDELTPKMQRMRMRLMQFNFTIDYVPGKTLGAADILSRHPAEPEGPADIIDEEIHMFVNVMMTGLPVTDERLAEILRAQQEDPICGAIMEYNENGWPRREQLHQDLLPFWPHRDVLMLEDGLLLKGTRIVIPKPLRSFIMDQIHKGHLGVVKCRARARDSVWWPGISKDVETRVQQCPECIQERTNGHEPLLPSEFPQRPWQKVAMDFFKSANKWYLVVTDYYSRYPEIVTMQNLQEETMINHLMSIFSRHGTPETVYTDCGTQFGTLLASKFRKFAKEWGFIHITSSPKFPQSNGFIEAMVKITKRTMVKAAEVYLALQHYRATPLSNGFSPAELLMGRRLRTTLPLATSKLKPQIPDEQQLRKKEEQRRATQKRNYDDHHRVHDLPALQPGDTVWIIDLRRLGVVEALADTPRSYIVKTAKQTVRRNRYHLIPWGGTPPRLNEEADELEDQLTPWREPTMVVDEPGPLLDNDQSHNPEISLGGPTEPTDGMGKGPIAVSPGPVEAGYRTRSGRLSKPPVRLNL